MVVNERPITCDIWQNKRFCSDIHSYEYEINVFVNFVSLHCHLLKVFYRNFMVLIFSFQAISRSSKRTQGKVWKVNATPEQEKQIHATATTVSLPQLSHLSIMLFSTICMLFFSFVYI